MEKSDTEYQTSGQVDEFVEEVAPQARPASKVRLMAIRLGGSLLLMALLLRYARVDWASVASAWSRVRVYDVLFVGVGFILMIGLKAARWRAIVAGAGVGYPFHRSLAAYLVGLSAGVVTPGRAGEFVRAAWLKAETGLPLGRSVGTVLADRLYDLLFLLSFGLAGFVALWAPGWRALWIVIVPAIWMAGLLGIHSTERILSLLPGRWHTAAPAVFIREAAHDMRGARLSATALSTAGYGVYFFLSWYIFRMAGVKIPLLDACFIVGAVGLALLLPVSVAGIGAREATVVFWLGKIGISSDMALAASLLHGAFFFGMGGLIGAGVLLCAPLKIRGKRV